VCRGHVAAAASGRKDEHSGKGGKKQCSSSAGDAAKGRFAVLIGGHVDCPAGSTNGPSSSPGRPGRAAQQETAGRGLGGTAARQSLFRCRTTCLALRMSRQSGSPSSCGAWGVGATVSKRGGVQYVLGRGRLPAIKLDAVGIGVALKVIVGVEHQRLAQRPVPPRVREHGRRDSTPSTVRPSLAGST